MERLQRFLALASAVLLIPQIVLILSWIVTAIPKEGGLEVLAIWGLCYILSGMLAGAGLLLVALARRKRVGRPKFAYLRRTGLLAGILGAGLILFTSVLVVVVQFRPEVDLTVGVVVWHTQALGLMFSILGALTIGR